MSFRLFGRGYKDALGTESPTRKTRLTVWKEEAFSRERSGNRGTEKRSKERHMCSKSKAENEKWPSKNLPGSYIFGKS